MKENVCPSEADRVSALLKILNSPENSTDIISKLEAVDSNWVETLKGAKKIPGREAEKPLISPVPSRPSSKSEKVVSSKRDGSRATPKSLNGSKKVRFPGGTITRLSKSIEDLELVEELKNLDCSFYEDCLDRAIDFRWPGFSCKNCENF